MSGHSLVLLLNLIKENRERVRGRKGERERKEEGPTSVFFLEINERIEKDRKEERMTRKKGTMKKKRKERKKVRETERDIKIKEIVT